MFAIKAFMVMLLCVLLCAPMTQAQQAQDKQPQAQASNAISQDVTIIIQQEKVRFTAQKSVEEMRLEIFDQTGELIYDSGAITESELNWPLKDADGETVKSGLYAYRLTIKEGGAETARVRRGHFIVDRAKERDGQKDRLWITSQSEDGVGTELTVARNEEATVAGTSTGSERASGKDGEKAEREGAATNEAKSKEKESQAALAVGGIGTPGQIAKFISEEEIGDSVITEASGNIGITGELTVTGAINTDVQYNIGGSRVVSIPGIVNLFAGVGAGASNTTGGFNAFFGTFAGQSNTTGSQNAFFGSGAGRRNETGINNAFFGNAAGTSNLWGHSNSFFGANVGFNNTTGDRNAFFGDRTGFSNTTGADNAFFGTFAGQSNTTGESNSFFGTGAGFSNTWGRNNVFIGAGAGQSNTNENGNTFIGTFSNGAPGITNATAIGFDARVTRSNSLVLGNNANVGIGTSAPQARLHVDGQTRTSVLQITGGSDFSENFDVNAAPAARDG